MMNLLDFIVLTLAASAIVDVWFNGSIFSDWRAVLQDKADGPVEPTEDTLTVDGGEPLPLYLGLIDRWTPRFIAELCSCDFCFSHHTPWIVGVVCFLPTLFITTPWLVFLLKLPAYSLAATRLGNLINAWAPTTAKYRHD